MFDKLIKDNQNDNIPVSRLDMGYRILNNGDVIKEEVFRPVDAINPITFYPDNVPIVYEEFGEIYNIPDESVQPKLCIIFKSNPKNLGRDKGCLNHDESLYSTLHYSEEAISPIVMDAITFDEGENAITFYDNDGNSIDQYIYDFLENGFVFQTIPLPEDDYNLEIISDANNLYDAATATTKGVKFKNSIQIMMSNKLKRVARIQGQLRSGNYKFSEPYRFELNERGHTRNIKAMNVDDRTVLHSLNDNVLLEKTIPKLIYDNGASLEGKGIDFTRKRFVKHLAWAHKHYNGHFYILFIDFSKFFDNIDHEKVIEDFKPLLTEAELKYLKDGLKSFEVDISYMNEQEAEKYKKQMFNSLEHDKYVEEHYGKEYFKNIKEKDRRTMKKSVDIGNQTSQIIGIYYPHNIDNFCKNVLGIHCYDRYMDDTAIMVPTKEDAHRVLDEIDRLAKEKGIFINKKKTRIVDPYTQPVTFLKINYFIDKKTGKIIKKINAKTIKRAIRRCKKLWKLVKEGKMTEKEYVNCHRSWRGTYKKYDSAYDIKKVDEVVRKNLGYNQATFKLMILDGNYNNKIKETPKQIKDRARKEVVQKFEEDLIKVA